MLRISGFVPYLTIVFLNAFIDLGHKIVIQNTVFKVYDGETQVVLTAIVMIPVASLSYLCSKLRGNDVD